jgi:very-short-patch-repair endonuclease
MTSPEALAGAVRAHSGRRGVKRLTLALPFLDERSESPQESRLRYALVRANLDGLVANLPITTSDGHRYRADLAFPKQKVIVEYQSGLHDSPAAFRADMTRVSRLESDGWKVVLVNADDLDNPAELVERIARVLRSRPAF